MAKIIGNTTATPNPQSDWNQTDETKADYIKNKPTILTEEDVVELIASGGIPVVYILSADAKDGDLCLYAPQNTLTLADSEKRIYFDWDEFSKPVEEGNNSQINCLLASEYDGVNDATNLEIGIVRDTSSCIVSITDVAGNNFSVDFNDGVFGSAMWGETELNSIEELPTYYQLPYFDKIYDWYTEGDTYLFHSEYELMKYQGGEWIAAVEADISDEQIAAAVRDYLNENPIEGGSVEIDTTLTVEGMAADAKATGDRLTDIEYQTVITDLVYEHKGLPIGEKTVTVSGDGTFGNNTYVVSGEDMIPRKTFNRSFPYNGITVTKNDKTYHIEGTATADGSVVFIETKNIAVFEIDKDISGKSFKLLSFANEYINKWTLSVRFYDGDKKEVKVYKADGNLSAYISNYVGSANGYRETAFSIPENVEIKYMQVSINFKADVVYNHDFQFYVVEAENTQTVTLDNPTITITDENITSVFSAPYQSTTEVKAPIDEYIKYMTANAKGDTATYLTPEAFGAVGDGYTDDIEAITACLAMASATGQTILMAKKYFVSAPIDIKGNNFNININDIVYNGTDAAVKIHGQKNTIKIHSITSSGVGIKFLGDGTTYSEWTLYNDLEVNTIVAASHGITFSVDTGSSYQNTVRFNYIKAGGEGCYGIAYFRLGDASSFGEDNFYGGNISNCEWACYGVRGNSKFYGIEIEGEVQGGFYIYSGVQIFHPRIAESQRDGNLPIYKFIDTAHTTIYDSSGISINQIDLSEAEETYVTSGNTHTLTENRMSKINGKIIARIIDGENTIGINYCRDSYIWGKYLIMTPFMAYRKEVTTATLDTRLIGQETTEAEIKALSQLPTKFVVNTTNTEIYLHESYCAFGFNEFEVEQANGFTCKVYDKLNNLIFDGTEQGDGLYKLNVYKDATYCASRSGTLRVDFLGHYWSVTKESISATDDGQGNVTLTTGVISI